MRTIGAASCLVMSLTGVALAAESQPPVQDWTILSSPGVREWGLAEAVTARLSGAPGVQLVEREPAPAYEVTFTDRNAA